MRIISGERRGLILKSPVGTETRPTLDRVRESLFSILQNRIPGARVLDLYAGAGTLGLEALSRGAEQAVFVERSKSALAVLRYNIKKAAYNSKSVIINEDWWQGQNKVEATGHKEFDLILADPPYEHGRDRELISTALPFLRPDGLFILQGGLGLRERISPLDEIGGNEIDHRTYGKTELLFVAST